MGKETAKALEEKALLTVVEVFNSRDATNIDRLLASAILIWRAHLNGNGGKKP